MERPNQNIQDVYNERHLFDPPSTAYEDDHSDDPDAPMLPRTAASALGNNTCNTSHIIGSNDTLKIVFLTLCLAGLQFTWTVEMAYGTPYLLSLGLSKSIMSLVWIAGPLSGLVMQPVVGVISDNCRSKWGRRRPFLWGGSVVVVFSLLVIGWTREVTWFFTRQPEDNETFKTLSIIIAVSSIYILDFSINCVQASCRALLVDSLPSAQQEDGTAWAGRMVGLGNVAGYFMGYVNLVKIFPFLGNTQLKVLCVLATLILLGCVFVTCYTVKEKVLDPDSSSRKRNRSPIKLFADIFRHIWHLPKPIQNICNVQFFAWIGWFPFLFYSTTWVAEIYNRNLTDADTVEDKVGQATRAGSFAFLVYSLVSLSSSFLLPWIVVSSSQSSASDYSKEESGYVIKLYGGKKIRLSCLNYLKLSFLTLPRAWTMSHFIFCICMLATFLVEDVTAAAIVIGVCGISWATSMWAPFSLLGEYISEQEALLSKSARQHGEGSQEGMQETTERFHYHMDMMASRASLAGITMIGTEPAIYHPVSTEEEEEEDIEMLGIKGSDQRQDLPGGEASTNSTAEERNMSESSEHGPPAAGVLLGIHNMYIVLPQFLVTFFSSIVFRILESDEGSTDTIGFILRVGAVMAGVAGFISLRIKQN
ncbi:major facilitator superfamily domain-containing protein [Choanephora cucurbitarum]|nr:major facilitator superfamily domain-containing protein [Choanephora cucurbitarum]